MQHLIDFAESSEEFREIANLALNYDLVQGIVVDLDPFWLQAWRVAQRFGHDYLAWWVEHPIFHGGPEAYLPPLDRSTVDQWRPPGWSSYGKGLQLADDPLPYVVKICLRPGQGWEKIPHAGEFIPSSRRVRVVIETRPPATLRANPRKKRRPLVGGVSIGVGSNDFGTLGVIASMQPLHSYPDANVLGVWTRNAGPDRTSRAWAWKSPTILPFASGVTLWPASQTIRPPLVTTAGA